MVCNLAFDRVRSLCVQQRPPTLEFIRKTSSIDSHNEGSMQIQILETRVDRVVAQVEEVFCGQKDIKELLL